MWRAARVFDGRALAGYYLRATRVRCAILSRLSRRRKAAPALIRNLTRASWRCRSLSLLTTVCVNNAWAHPACWLRGDSAHPQRRKREHAQHQLKAQLERQQRDGGDAAVVGVVGAEAHSAL